MTTDDKLADAVAKGRRVWAVLVDPKSTNREFYAAYTDAMLAGFIARLDGGGESEAGPESATEKLIEKIAALPAYNYYLPRSKQEFTEKASELIRAHVAAETAGLRAELEIRTRQRDYWQDERNKMRAIFDEAQTQVRVAREELRVAKEALKHAIDWPTGVLHDILAKAGCQSIRTEHLAALTKRNAALNKALTETCGFIEETLGICALSKSIRAVLAQNKKSA